MQKRRFKHGAANHVYQRTINRYNIFYDHFDYIVYFTILSVVSEKYDILISGLCLMIDHIHILINARSKTILSRFVSHVTSLFVREYNSSVGRHGPLFEERFGSAPKSDKKRLLSCIIYIGNNPVEKKLCVSADEYRWNFLKYHVCRSPFSAALPKSQCSRSLRRCIGLVNAVADAGCYLNYAQMYGMFSKLNERDKEILTDHIITIYNPFDGGILNYYDDYEQMIGAMRSTAGAEHEIKEVWHNGTDRIYHDMTDWLKKYLKRHSVRNVIVLPVERKLELAELLIRYTGARQFEVAKFLHLKFFRGA